VPERPQLHFEWDFNKNRYNKQKHGVSFERAATVFLDPRAMSLFDDDHSGEEDRWITIGLDRTGIPVVVCHTYQEQSGNVYRIRLISARKATKREREQYRGSEQ